MAIFTILEMKRLRRERERGKTKPKNGKCTACSGLEFHFWPPEAENRM